MKISKKMRKLKDLKMAAKIVEEKFKKMDQEFKRREELLKMKS